MPHAIEMKDGKLLTVFDVRDMLEAVSDYGSHTYLRESIALAEQVTTIDKKAMRNVLCRVTSAEKQKEIEQALAGFFNMAAANTAAPDTTTNEEARTW